MTAPRRILVLHPDAAFLEAAAHCLQSTGWECHTCNTASAALAIAPHFSPDVLVLGVPLPGLSGSAALTGLRALPATWATPALILARQGDEEEMERLRSAGATRVFGAPLQPADLPSLLSEFLEEAQRSEGDAWQMQLAALHREFLSQLPEKVARIETGWRAFIESSTRLPSDNLSPHNNTEAIDLGRNVHREAHSLVGGGATFGFPEISAGARRLEITLRPLHNNPGETFGARQQNEVEKALADLKNLVQQSQGRISWVLGTGLPRLWRAAHERTVWLVNLPASVAPALARFGFSAQSFSVEEAWKAAAQLNSSSTPARPVAIVADLKVWLRWLNDDESDERKRQALSLPVLLAESDSFETRLQAVRAGADGFAPLPLDAEQLAEQLDSLASPRSALPLRVLLTCSEGPLAELYSLILAQQGLLVRIIGQAAQVPQAAQEFCPDLFLIDGALSDCYPVELGQVLRGYPAFATTPIIFLQDTWPEREITQLRMIGDEVLSVPVSPEMLVDAVAKRANRHRASLESQSRDPLTGLLTPTQWHQQLSIEISRTQRQSGELVCALLDIRDLKQINARQGYAAGDQVLRTLARLVSSRLRKTDVIGRDGGQLLVLLHGAPLQAAQDVLRILENDFAALRFEGNESQFAVQLRSAAAAFTALNTESSNLPEQLHEAAKAALQAAK
jgi:diguanylate cyclase (GGDEF)-like protein